VREDRDERKRDGGSRGERGEEEMERERDRQRTRIVSTVM